MAQKFKDKAKSSLIQKAFQVKKGELKLTDLPERKRSAVKSVADSISLDQLQAMAEPAPRTPRQVGHVREFTRTIRS